MDACIFNIGTWHDHTEDTNVLVKLWRACKFRNLGLIENQSGKETGKEALDDVKRALAYGKEQELEDRAFTMLAKNNGYKWINDGADSTGSGILPQTEVNVELLQLLSKNLAKVVIVGHSRGAVLSVRIAARLLEKQSLAECHLFLYDPVKRMVQGSDWYNREIHDNVKSIRVIAMEDQGQADFKLLTIKKRTTQGARGRTDIDRSEYTRLPGTHGTATQVTGHPIGNVGYMLALRWLRRLGIPLAHDAPTGVHALLKAYCEIPRKNSVTSSGRHMSRKVNDNGKNSGYKTVKVGGGRTALLDRKTDQNKFMGTCFFVNEEHCELFTNVYPLLGKIIAQGPEYHDSIDACRRYQDRLIPARDELRKLKAIDVGTYNYLKSVFPMLPNLDPSGNVNR